MNPRRLVVVVFLSIVPTLALAQDWNSEAVTVLIARAVERRAAVQTDSGLRDYRARAHGFVFFLGQLGELSEPPRLIKSDQLEVEVYWKAPGVSKQRIVGWRDRADLPTDIRYHRDHLGIVTNNFGDRIGLGHNDEVRDVPHPLAPDGPSLYDYALVDSLTIRMPPRAVRVYRVRTRPKDLNTPGVVGTLYIDVDEAELVQFRFNFTRSAYVDDTLEDITIVLENGLWDGRYWLPRRQEIEIRRRTAWLDLPARGIIRGRWEIDGYRFNTNIPDTMLRGPVIVAAPTAVRDTFRWSEPLDAAVRAVATQAVTFDLAAVRAEVKNLAQDRVLSGLSGSKPGVGAVSDLLHFNRVEGLAPGFGWVFRPGGGAAEIRLWASYGMGDNRLKGRFAVRRRMGRFTVGIEAARVARDVADERVIAAALNSLLAQEVAQDYGDYYLATGGSASLRLDLGPRSTVGFSLGVQRSTSMMVQATAATDTFRLNPDLGAGTFGFAALTVERRTGGFALGRGVSGALTIEGGSGEERQYVRVRGRGRLQFPIGATDLVARGWVGWGSVDLPRHRAFVLGGRGSLVGEPFRAWGGRRAAVGTLEWRIPIPFPALPLGSFTSTGDRVFLAPFVAAGWTDGALPQFLPWRPTDGVRPVIGLGMEWFHSLFRADFATSLRDGGFRVVVGIRRDLWGIL